MVRNNIHWDGVVTFLLKYGDIVVKLSRLLNTTFMKKEDFEKPIGRALKEIVGYYNAGLYQFADYEIARLRMLTKHLQEIEQCDPTLLQKYGEKINKSDSDYYGFRFEVAVASSFIRKKLRFITPDPPDFKVTYNSEEIFIECTSRHISPNKSLDVLREVERAINKKGGRRYDIPKCALFIDITNLCYLAHLKNQVGQFANIKEFKESVRQILEKYNFGSVLLFIYIMNKTEKRFELDYVRVDNKCIDHVLRNFLDESYPMDEHDVSDFAIPKHG